QSYSHAEYGIPYYADAWRLRVEYASENEARWIAVDDSFPEQLRESRWSSYVWPKPPSVSPARIQALEHAHGCFAYVPAEAQAVFAVSDDVENFTHAGHDRFAGRFAGVETRLDSATDARHAWYVIDGLERQDLGTLRALRKAGAGIVAYARNARSYRRMHGALEGASFPNGRALGISETRRLLVEFGRPDVEDRIESTDLSGFIWSKVPPMLQDLVIRDVRFPELRRELLADFLAHAFIFRFPPNA
ncbi:MAG: hypothetical protein JO349_04695, partial [Candidatus Eremiobacteraeota bacterium]|nr:hypothetical protein [Candidatus Eremiobacteraeota bacterium]